MYFIKGVFIRLISLGTFSEMEEAKKIAIQIASFDAFASLVTFLFYFLSTFKDHFYSLATFHITAFFLCLLGIHLLHKRYYDSGRMLIHYVGLIEIFLSVDGVKPTSGYEFYYFAPLIVPFVTFTCEEVKKSLILSASAVIAFIIQQYVGIGRFSSIVEISQFDQHLAMGILFTYLAGLLFVSRSQINMAHQKIKIQHDALIQISNIASLGVMSGGIAHEINNPLQILATRVTSLKKQLLLVHDVPNKAYEQINSIEKTIDRIAKIVKGLKSLSRNTTDDQQEIFHISESIEDVLIICNQRLIDLGISLEIKGETFIKTKGHIVQFSQVLLNLLNNSIDALETLIEKWIFIEITHSKETIILTVTDSGRGIEAVIAEKIMLPFFTTKEPGRGTGLGLSISHNIIEKSGGRLFYDKNSPNTKFVIEMPFLD
jgi:signal transduction histidine kinase